MFDVLTVIRYSIRPFDEVIMAEALATLVDSAHADAFHLIELAGGSPEVDPGGAADPGGANATPSDPRQVLRANDVAVAAISAHLSAMEAVVYPMCARNVPGGRARVTELRRLARRSSSVMRGIEQYVQGDLNRPAASVTSLRRDLAVLLTEHAQTENALLHELDRTLSDSERTRLRERFSAAMRHAPSRPHPHLGHGGPFGGSATVRLLGTIDHLLDVMDAREVAGAPVRAPAPAGLWGWYLLGRPTAPAPEWPAETLTVTTADPADGATAAAGERARSVGGG
ncbi:hemerythrin domain-containing protein [Frankia sp. AgPm24]|uniref:hemerythrin domain-containing protein n=1 Tax=Frankia sp. AgPm24 TaxID=631128 RepID=UPI00200CC23D|nr:hemerythrin domain-containing protein [Frankia sp. AgPm24]MCK9923194.1 hemerythrin domain-containing protein [Frankia sp. AgPm24]